VASRAEYVGSPAAPPLTKAVRSALTDFYFNSGRLVPVNIVWGGGLVLIVLVALIWPLGAFVLAPLLAIPTAGTFCVAARIVRNDQDISLRDALAATRADARPILLLGLAFVAAAVILGSNMVAGLTSPEPLGWVIGTFAAWGLIVLWCGALVAWPLLVDPSRAERPPSERLRLAGALLLAYPVRLGGLGAVVAVFVVVSAILAAVLLTVGVAFVALVACRYVYPAADRLEVRLEDSP
jgi:uncharacterized membrane protein YesL